jgi:hypothetical protein
MKLAGLLTAVIFLSCHQVVTPIYKARKSIVHYMKDNINDPHSYEPVDFSLDSAIDMGNVKWQADHTFRAKNGFGALQLFHYRFYLDSTFYVMDYKDMAGE